MNTTQIKSAKCCHCNGKGIVAGGHKSDLWVKCRDCQGTGFGENVFSVLKLQATGTGPRQSFEWFEVIGGSFHARDIDQALQHATWVYGPHASVKVSQP